MEHFRPCHALRTPPLWPLDLDSSSSFSSPLSSRLKSCCRRHTYRPLSPPRTVKTTVYTTPRQSNPCSGPDIAEPAHCCVQDILSLFLLECQTSPRNHIPSFFTPSPTPSRLAYLYLSPLAWPRPTGATLDMQS